MGSQSKYNSNSSFTDRERCAEFNCTSVKLKTFRGKEKIDPTNWLNLNVNRLKVAGISKNHWVIYLFIVFESDSEAGKWRLTMMKENPRILLNFDKFKKEFLQEFTSNSNKRVQKPIERPNQIRKKMDEMVYDGSLQSYVLSWCILYLEASSKAIREDEWIYRFLIKLSSKNCQRWLKMIESDTYETSFANFCKRFLLFEPIFESLEKFEELFDRFEKAFKIRFGSSHKSFKCD